MNLCRHRLSSVDLWDWSELGLESSRAAEVHSELVLMMTTKKSCHLNCWICLLSGFRELVVRLVQVSGVSCVSRDAVRLVQGPRRLPDLEQQGCSGTFGRFQSSGCSRSQHAVLCVPTMCPRFVSDLPNQIALSRAVYPLWSLFPDDNRRCSSARILNKMVSASGTLSCV